MLTRLLAWPFLAKASISNGFRRAALFAAIALTTSPAAAQTITKFAGGWSPDGIAATASNLNAPSGLTLDSAGNLFVGDAGDYRIRKINALGIISTAVGSGWQIGIYGTPPPSDQTIAGNRNLYGATSTAVAPNGDLLVADTNHNQVLRVSGGKVSVFAGNGHKASTTFPVVDGIQAVDSVVSSPSDIVVDPVGNTYIVEYYGNRVRRVAPDGVISTVAGTGALGYSGDGGPATEATFYRPRYIALDGLGNLYVSDSGNGRIRKIDSSGIISTAYVSSQYLGDLAAASDGTLLVAESSATGSSGSRPGV